MDIGFTPSEDGGETPKAATVMMPGCCDISGNPELVSACRFLQKMGIEYTFLEKQLCCGAPLVMQAVRSGEDPTPAEKFCREFVETNASLAAEKGANTMVFTCTWCAYMHKRFLPDAEPRPLFIGEFLLESLNGASLKMPQQETVGYFSGCPHRRQVFDPDEVVDLRWEAYPRLLSSIEGLEVVNIPRYCCTYYCDLIFGWAKKRGLRTIVASCGVCYRRLHTHCLKGMGQGIEVKFITDIVMEAMGSKVPLGEKVLV
ncbi:MAG: (Fe-S)-binding protein [Chloroflexi bacterium]|nr:(Fe-S)-binding protein [Chloroflexota bacterium]